MRIITGDLGRGGTSFEELIDLGRQQSILVVGLGNQEITADSLAPRAVSNLHMTRHVIREYGLKSNEHMKMHHYIHRNRHGRSYETCLYILLYVHRNVKMFFAKIPKKYAKNTRCCVEKGK